MKRLSLRRVGVKAKARVTRGRSSALALVAGSFCAACLATPRVEDAPAPRDYLRQAAPAKQDCDAPVELLGSAGNSARPYREVATLSATCYPGAKRVCEQRLIQRACALHADAVILIPPSAGGTPPGASAQSEVSLSGRAVVWNRE